MQSSRCATALMGFLPSVVAHGFIEYPPLRAGTVGKDANAWCPQCGNGAGICGDGGQWGEDSDLLNYPRGPVTTLRSGEIAEFSVTIAAHHKGWWEFRICDQHLDGSLADPEACLNQHLLQRVPPEADCQVNDDRGDCQPLDSRHPERWYLPPGAGTYKMKYKIPADLRCTSCTLQWQWFTGNSCMPGDDTNCYWEDFGARGWNKRAWCGAFCGTGSGCSSLLETNSSSGLSTHSARGCGEEFRNCADIAVLRAGEEPVTTPSTPSEGTSSDNAEQSSCSDVWGQCGGSNWKGPFCCKVGNSCVEQNQWYSQCKPGAVSPAQSSSSGEQPAAEKPSETEPASEPEAEPEAESENEDKGESSSSPSEGTSSDTSSCSDVWGQCGGSYWKGPFCCKTGNSCVEQSQWYSQCTPAPRSLLQRKKHQFLGLGLIQDGATRARGPVSDEL